jgi:LysR family glycine cleavage system transcriptional activator
VSLTLPPLNALRAFEVAARRGGFVAAGQELGVSPSAVSQQVTNLERYFGRELFRRANNRVALTDAGRAIYAQVARALHGLSDMTRGLLEGEARPQLVVSLPASLAERWFLPRLAAFLAQAPGFSVDLRIEDDPVDFARHNLDLRVSYGAETYAELAVLPLAQDAVLPLCTPETWARLGATGLEGVPDAALIHTHWGPSYASHPTWGEWFAAAGLPRQPRVAAGHRVSHSSLALELALAGAGVALGQRLLAAGELAAGRLLAPDPRPLPLGQPYCLVHPHRKAGRPGLQSLLQALTAG